MGQTIAIKLYKFINKDVKAGWFVVGVSHLIGFVVEKMNKLLGPSLSRMIAPFFLFAILAEGQLAILRCNYEIYQLHHSVWNCQMRPGSILAVINHTNIFQLFCSVFLQPFLPSSDLSLFAIFHLFLDPRSEESHAHLINLEISQGFARKLKN